MKVSTVVDASQHSAITEIASERGATVGAVVELALRRFIRDWKKNPRVAHRLKIDGRRREARK